MLNSLRTIIEDNDNLAIQDTSLLTEGLVYYFTEVNDKNIYRGKFKNTFNNEHKKRFVFNDVEIYNGTGFQIFTYQLSTPNINKIYCL